MMQEAQRWLSQAKSDLEAANLIGKKKLITHSHTPSLKDAQVSINHSEKILEIVSKLVKN